MATGGAEGAAVGTMVRLTQARDPTMTLSLQSLPAPNPRSADPEVLAREIVERLAYRVGKDPKVAKPHDWLQAVILITRDRAIEYWMNATRTTYLEGEKRVYYLSLEFLIGRLMRDAVSNLGLTEAMRAALEAPRRRLRRDRRARGRRRPRQRRPRPPRRLLHGEHGDRRRARLRLRHPLPPRPLPPGDPRRQPGRAARDLARARQPLGVRPPRGGLRHRLRRPGRVPRPERRRGALRLAAGREGEGDRLRHPDRRLARRAGEHAPALEGRPDRPDPPRRLQRRRPFRQPRREQPRRRADPRPLPRRHLARRAGAAPPPGVFLLLRLAAGHPAPAHAAVRPARQPRRQGGDPAQRHPPGGLRRRADAAAHGRPRARLRRGLGAHHRLDRLHQPHAPARGAGELAGAALRAAAAAAHADHLRDQRPPAEVGAGRAQDDRRRDPQRQPDRRDRRAAGAHGQPRLRRRPLDQRRRGDALGAPEGDALQGSAPDVPGPDQQQDQRHHPAPLAAAVQPRPDPAHRRHHRPEVPRRHRRAARPREARRRARPSRTPSPG